MIIPSRINNESKTMYSYGVSPSNNVWTPI